MQPTIGRIVLYKLTQDDVIKIHRRRTTGASIAERIKRCTVSAVTPSEGAVWLGPNGGWPAGAQAHIGSSHYEGQELPLIVCRVWPHEFGQDKPGVNGQIFLDGNDTLWVTSIGEGEDNGQWHWPIKV